MTQDAAKSYLFIFCELILGNFPCAEFVIYIFIKVELAVSHQTQGGECGDWFTDRSSLEKSLRRYGPPAGDVGKTIGSSPTDLTMIVTFSRKTVPDKNRERRAIME